MRRVLMMACGVVGSVVVHPLQAQDKVPVRSLAPVQARSSETMAAILTVRQLPGGKVLVNDGRTRRLVVLDSMLARTAIVFDSASGVTNSYGPRSAPLIPYVGDSSLFVDFAGQALVMIDPAGKAGRAVAPPNARDLGMMGTSAAGSDQQGRLVYRGMGPTYSAPKNPGEARTVSGRSTQADSLPILRADFQARTVDTLANVKNINASHADVSYAANGQPTMKVYINPLPAGDEWAVLSDGSIAIVRGHDYHIDWIAPDGTQRSTPKMPFDWKRLTDADKQALVDSARAARDAAASAARSGAPPGSADGRGGGGGMMVQAAPQRAAGSVEAGAPPPGMSVKVEYVFVPLSEMPDYLPPIRSGAARGDLDGNLWILPSTSAQSTGGELVYDMVNLKGEVFQRVRVPAGRSIAGFGKGGVVYLQAGDLKSGFALERTRINK